MQNSPIFFSFCKKKKKLLIILQVLENFCTNLESFAYVMKGFGTLLNFWSMWGLKPNPKWPRP